MTSSTQIYIGGLRGEVHPEDLKYEFKKFGPIKEFSYKGKYAFIDYEEPADAARAIKEMDDEYVTRVRITVEAASKCHHKLDLTDLCAETTPRGGDRRDRSPSPNDACFKCNRTGHW